MLTPRHLILPLSWPGNTHDSRIFENSSVCARFERRNFPGILIGDNGYPLRPYLITLLLTCRTPQERCFNFALSNGRVKIDNGFGIWKRRFPCLRNQLRFNISSTLHIIIACAVLYNIARKAATPVPDDDYEGDIAVPVPVLPCKPRRTGFESCFNTTFSVKKKQEPIRDLALTSWASSFSFGTRNSVCCLLLFSGLFWHSRRYLLNCDGGQCLWTKAFIVIMSQPHFELEENGYPIRESEVFPFIFWILYRYRVVQRQKRYTNAYITHPLSAIYCYM